MGKFEDSWKGVFEQAEAIPSDSVWSGIDGALEGGEMKKRLVFYQRVAAAAVLFALLVGGYEIYRWTDDNRVSQFSFTKKSQNNNSQIESGLNKEEAKNSNQKSDSKNEGEQSSLTKENENENNLSATLTENSKQSKKTEQIPATKDNDEREVLTKSKNENNSTFENYFQSDVKYVSANDEVTLQLLPGPEVKGKPVVKEFIRKLPAIPAAFMADTRRDKTPNENVWASLTASSGSYNPNMGNSSVYSAGNNSSIGTSYSMSMLGGARIAKNWTLQSGIQYLNQSINGSSYASSSYSLATVAGALTVPGLYNLSPGLAPVNVMSTSEFVSVPVQAGYLIVNRKFGWQVNSGVSTDFFIRNTLSDGQRQSFTQSAGSDSPYRSVNFSGLMSSEVSYKLSQHYRISLVPGFRYSFNPMLKSSANTSGNPWLWDFGFRFKYIFK
ncbi:MAG: hypothetical protein QM734_09750 [Cyclobacteriaceae bacterium]